MSPKLRTAAAALFWLAVWQFAAWQVNSPLFLPTPLAVVLRLGKLIQTASFWQMAAASLCRVVLGMLWGTVLGVVLAAFIENLQHCVENAGVCLLNLVK